FVTVTCIAEFSTLSLHDALPIFFYISGIWVDEQFKSKGLGRLIIRTLIECGVQSCFGQLPHKIFIALRTQNPQIYEFFNRYYDRSEEHTSELQSRENLVCRLLLE